MQGTFHWKQLGLSDLPRHTLTDKDRAGFEPQTFQSIGQSALASKPQPLTKKVVVCIVYT